jgi:hypothetical protein
MADTNGDGLESLQRDECYYLLSTRTVGRVAVTIGALPNIFPVNYRVQGNRIVFFGDAGSKLAAALDGSVVAFQVDQTDDFTDGWSVNVVGVASVESGLMGRMQAEISGLEPWVPAALPFVVSVEMALVRGHRLPPPAMLPPVETGL